ncbi:MAG: hypothetical protein SAJ72_21850 [Jaaginema sp. PMC 1080.18]|nr:hypothetical protein [Jaaginema sp. PMC 1080.18]MEC4868783.1 hypothetical protein [Jaaginema sp. PMC 1078.18]
MTNATNFHLSLYAFHSRNTLEDSPDTVNSSADRIWESLIEFGQQTRFKELINLKSHLNCYTPNSENNEYKFQDNSTTEWLTDNQKPIDLSPIVVANKLAIAGNLQPFRLHDTYCIDLTLSPITPDSQFSIQDIGRLYPAKLIKEIQADLGKVFWLTGEKRYFLNPQKDAENWVEAFCQTTGLEFTLIESGKFLNSHLFIYQAENIILLVSIAKSQQADLERAERDYAWFRDLWWSHQKVVFAYKEALACYQKARNNYSNLEQKSQIFSQILVNNDEDRLDQINSLLQTIPQNLLEYSCALRDLKAHYTTIETNAENFKICLDRVLTPNDNVKTWSDFSLNRCPHYLSQIQIYLNYLEPGKDLFTDFINTIQTTAAIDQAQSDRERLDVEKKLQDSLQAVGVGIAAGAIVASTSGLITQPWKSPNLKLPPHPFIIALVGSVLCSFGAWWVAKKLIERKQK